MKPSRLVSKGKPCCDRTLCSCGTRPKLRRVRVNPVNRRRKAAEFKRAFGGAERAAWVKAQPCAVCYQTPSENAHIVGGGGSRRADADTVANLCHRHHRTDTHSLHNLGSVRRFEEYWNIDLRLVAADLERRWQAHNA